MNLKKSLKSIRKNIEKKNTIFQTIKRVYTHLAEFSNDEILLYYHVKSTQELTAHVEYIKKVILEKKEDYKKNIEEMDNCFCSDGKGNFKDLYLTEKLAKQQIEQTKKEQRVKLKFYPCPYNCGWHLTKG